MSKRRAGALKGLSAVLMVVGVAAVGIGCENAGQGAVSGASVGALSGLAIGSLSGNAGRGAAIGAIGGGVGGAVVGDQNRRSRENAQTARQPVPVAPPPPPPPPPQPTQVVVQMQAPTPPPPPPPPPAMSTSDRDRLQLAKFARPWRVSGWETVDGQRRFVTGNATGQVDSTFFVRLDMVMTDELTNRVNTGNVVFASEPGRGLTMNSRFDSSPTAVAFAGSVTADGNLFTLNEIAPGSGANGRQVVIRFLSPDNFVADTTDRRTGQQTSSFTFTTAR